MANDKNFEELCFSTYTEIANILNALQGLIVDIEKASKKLSTEEIKILLSTIGKEYTLKDDNLTLQLKEPFNFVARLNKSKSSNKTDLLRG